MMLRVGAYSAIGLQLILKLDVNFRSLVSLMYAQGYLMLADVRIEDLSLNIDFALEGQQALFQRNVTSRQLAGCFVSSVDSVSVTETVRGWRALSPRQKDWL